MSISGKLCSSYEKFQVGLYDCQEALTEFQAIPIIGPVIVSPIKATLSCAVIVSGLAVSIIFGALSVLPTESKEWYGQVACESIGFVGLCGVLSLLSSVVNMATLGLFSPIVHCVKSDIA